MLEEAKEQESHGDARREVRGAKDGFVVVLRTDAFDGLFDEGEEDFWRDDGGFVRQLLEVVVIFPGNKKNVSPLADG